VVDAVDAADLYPRALALEYLQDELESELRGVVFGFLSHVLSSLIWEKVPSPEPGASLGLEVVRT
jgi:hypothetical protein